MSVVNLDQSPFRGSLDFGQGPERAFCRAAGDLYAVTGSRQICMFGFECSFVRCASATEREWGGPGF